jgi:glycine dehydrogenase subunit 1
MQRTEELITALTKIAGVKRAFTAPHFHESVVLLDRPPAAVLRALSDQGILGGLDLSERYPELGNALLVCATETKQSVDIDAYAAALARVMNSSRAAA